MRILGGLIEIGRDRPVTCGCGRPAVRGTTTCTRCARVVKVDAKKSGKTGAAATSWTPCPTGDGGRVRNGVCPVAGCEVGVKPSRR